MEPCLLAIDTSTERMALSLSWSGGCLTQLAEGGAASSAGLLPLAAQMLCQAQLRFDQLDAVAFAAGPGAFTGLRTACAVAQGLAYAHARPVLPLDSLLLVADDAMAQAPQAGPVWVAMDARMDEVYAAAYEQSPDGLWRPHQAPALYTLPALAQAWAAAPPTCIAGSAVAVFGDRLPWGAARLVPQELDRAQALARLARSAWQQGRGIPAEQALPLYLRDKVASTTEERARAAAAKG